MTIIKAHREYSFSYGHRVMGHENKCAKLHGHNGIITFYCEAPKLDKVGRVIDFSVIKDKLCNWVEENWDHKFLVYEKDFEILNWWGRGQSYLDLWGIVYVPFNPTSENMAEYLLNVVGPQQLKNTGVELVRVNFMETPKCGVEVEKIIELDISWGSRTTASRREI